MPIYEYVCQGCEARIEIKQKLSDPPLTTCERCGKPLTKVISSPGIMFKGTGWYVTDYSDKMKPPSGTEAGKADGTPPASDTKPADAKAAPAASTPAPAANTAGTGAGGGSTPSKPTTGGGS